jgi:hypothetical protein
VHALKTPITKISTLAKEKPIVSVLSYRNCLDIYWSVKLITDKYVQLNSSQIFCCGGDIRGRLFLIILSKLGVLFVLSGGQAFGFVFLLRIWSRGLRLKFIWYPHLTA